jgi:hypothetical protein
MCPSNPMKIIELRVNECLKMSFSDLVSRGIICDSGPCTSVDYTRQDS